MQGILLLHHTWPKCRFRSWQVRGRTWRRRAGSWTTWAPSGTGPSCHPRLYRSILAWWRKHYRIRSNTRFWSLMPLWAAPSKFHNNFALKFIGHYLSFFCTDISCPILMIYLILKPRIISLKFDFVCFWVFALSLYSRKSTLLQV